LGWKRAVMGARQQAVLHQPARDSVFARRQAKTPAYKSILIRLAPLRQKLYRP